MPERIYSKDEFLEKVGLDAETLTAILNAQVLRPAGRVDGETPYFNEQGVEAAEAISKLIGMGYSVEDVIRIRRKIGLPKKRGHEIRKGKPLLTVGELANRIGSNPRTIKHWEEKGIIEPDSYSPGGFRLYSETYVQLCLLIQDLQLFGYTLDQIKAMADLLREFLAIKTDPTALPPDEVMGNLARVTEQITEINDKMRLFEKGIERWRGLMKQKQREISLLKGKVERDQRRSQREAEKKEDVLQKGKQVNPESAEKGPVTS